MEHAQQLADLNLDRSAIEQFWRERGGEVSLHQVLSMDENEPWVVDTMPVVEPLLIAAMLKVSENTQHGAQILRTADPTDILTILGYTRSSRSLRILIWAAALMPEVVLSWAEAAIDISQECDEDNERAQRLLRVANVMVGRCQSFERSKILAESFSPMVTRRLRFFLRLYSDDGS